MYSSIKILFLLRQEMPKITAIREFTVLPIEYRVFEILLKFGEAGTPNRFLFLMLWSGFRLTAKYDEIEAYYLLSNQNSFHIEK